MPVFAKKMEDDGYRILMQQIYRKYFRLVNSRIADAIPASDVEDCVQDCFVRLAHNIDQLESLESSQLTQYILLTIRSVITDYKRKRRAFVLDADVVLKAGTVIRHPVEDAVEEKEMYEAFITGFHSLSEIDQVVLRGLYQDHLSREEVAEILGIKSASIRTYISRAKKHARQLMRGEFDEN